MTHFLSDEGKLAFFCLTPQKQQRPLLSPQLERCPCESNNSKMTLIILTLASALVKRVNHHQSLIIALLTTVR